MNAYELLEKITGLNSCEPVIIKACEDVIRQQAKRIEELEHCLIVEQEHNQMLQHKELSDEEIRDIWYQHEKWLATVPYSFARAIIKASRGEE